LTATVPWLSIDLYPDDNADRMLRLPDGREVIGSRRRNLLGTPNGWQTKTPHEFDEPIYEQPLRGGFMIDACASAGRSNRSASRSAPARR
jgi:hypothetical protein